MPPHFQTANSHFGHQNAWPARDGGMIYAGGREGRAAGGRGATDAAGQTAMPLVGCSPVMKQLFGIMERVAQTDSSVFITGATGTGKELVARAIHARSPRRNAPFVDVNCSAIPESLLEAELFGHQRGAFTGAHETRRGLFEMASGGTLFLDEVDALPPAAQAKLLRVIQERSLRRVGGRENIAVDVRIISATNRDIRSAVAEGTFRADLLFRLRVVPLRVPELHERGEGDIRLLTEHFLRRHAARSGCLPRGLSAEAACALASYSWPGNVRELENTIEYALAIGTGPVLGIEDLPPEVLGGGDDGRDMISESVRLGATLADLERRYILSVLERCGWHQLRTAAVLGIDRRTLYRKLKEYRVTADKSADAPARVLAGVTRPRVADVSGAGQFKPSAGRGGEWAA